MAFTSGEDFHSRSGRKPRTAAKPEATIYRLGMSDEVPVGVMAAYQALVREGTWRHDPAQVLATETLQILSNQLPSYAPSKRQSWAERLGFKQQTEVSQGLYLYGAVGRG